MDAILMTKIFIFVMGIVVGFVAMDIARVTWQNRK